MKRRAFVGTTLAGLAVAGAFRAVQNFRTMTPEECAVVRKRAVSGAGVYTGTTLEYWKKRG